MNPMRNVIQVCTDDNWEPSNVRSIDHWRIRLGIFDPLEQAGVTIYLHWLYGGRLAFRASVEEAL